MGSLSPIHWLIVVLVLVVLFGAKRLPDASRSIGRSLRIFKSEMKDMGADGDKAGVDKPVADTAAAPAPQAPAPQQLPAASAPLPPASPSPAQHVQAERVEKAS